MTKSYIKDRQSQLKQSLIEHNLRAVALNPGPDLTYFTGLNFHLMERPIICIFPSEGSPVLILPELEQAKLSDLEYEIRPFLFSEDQSSWSNVMKEGLTEAGLKTGKLGVIPRRNK